VVKDRQDFLNQRGGGSLRGLDAFARGAFLEILQIGGGAQERPVRSPPAGSGTPDVVQTRL